MIIRLFEDKDRKGLLKVLAEGLKVQEKYAASIDPPEDKGFFDAEWEEHISGISQHPEEWTVCKANGRIVGLLWVRFLQDKIGLYGTVREVIVASDCRNLGIGTKLIDYAEDLAQKRNADFFLISGLSSNTAIQLYRRHGFSDFPDRFKRDKNPNHTVLWKPYSEKLRKSIIKP